MKLSLLSNVLLASMMIFAVSCGKDSKKKKDPYYYNYNQYVGNQQQTANGTTARANLQSYIDGVDSNTNIFGPILVQKAKQSCGDLWGISFLQTCGTKGADSETVQVIPGRTRAENHSILATLFTSPAGYTLGTIVQYGNIVYVQHYKGSFIYEYTVDMSRHSAVNPVQVKDTEAQKIIYVTGPSI